MDLHAGDLVLVPFPFTDLRARKTRPALVLSSSSFHATGSDIVVAAVTSNIRDVPYSVLVSLQDLEEGQLPKPSRVKVGKLLTIERTIVRRRIGRIRKPMLDAVYRELRGVLDWDL